MKHFMTVVLFCLAGVPSSVVADCRISISANHVSVIRSGQIRNVSLLLGFDCQEEWVIRYHRQGCPDEGGYPCHPRAGFDHLVVKDLDNPTDHGHAVATWDMEEFPWRDELFGYVTCTYGCYQLWHSPPPYQHYCDSALFTSTHTGYATILITLPDCGRYRIYYVKDELSWDRLGEPFDGCEPEPTPRFVMLGSAPDWICHPRGYALVDYITNNLNTVDYAYADVDMGPCPYVPPADGTIRFIGYVIPGGDSCWYPVPGDSIGLRFGVNSPSGLPYRISYWISDMSMWKGVCLNSPRYAGPDPEPTGFEGPLADPDSLTAFTNWDVTVCQREQYRFIVGDLRMDRWGFVPKNPWWEVDSIPAPLFDGYNVVRPYDLTVIVATTTAPVHEDTLWIKALDYAAHCIVTPEIMGGGKDRFLHGFASPWGDSLRCVNIPADYDGFSGQWVNLGDGMADCWEQRAFNVVDTRPIRPYFTVPPPLAFADLDSLPTGRDIDGDYLCNFEEYRGAMVRADCTGSDLPARHVRFGPLTKTLMVHVRANVEDSTKAQVPGYIYQLPSVETYFTDNLRWGPDSSWDTEERIESKRDSLNWRDYNFNKAGAGRWYVGYALPTAKPVPDTSEVHALTLWRWQRTRDQRARPWEADSLFGRSHYYYVFGSSVDNAASVPRKFIRAYVVLDHFNQVGSNSYYRSHPQQWQQDYRIQLRKTIAHELGHGIGMIHPPDSETHHTIMSKGWHYPSGELLPVDTVYSDSSNAQFSIKQR